MHSHDDKGAGICTCLLYHNDAEACRWSLGPSQASSVDEDSSKKASKLSMVANQIKIEQMLEEFESAAEMSFDYVMLPMIAIIIADVGLAVNNTVVILASVLVSPIMGPVLALTFGATVHDWELCRLGLRSELISLCVCVLVGFLIGLVCIGIGLGGHWPTDEMRSRGVIWGCLSDWPSPCLQVRG
ncbi:DUF389 domain-containing protein [archaeon]|nr:MAG: DUF389 domain-containing protein [archaeon]